MKNVFIAIIFILSVKTATAQIELDSSALALKEYYDLYEPIKQMAVEKYGVENPDSIINEINLQVAAYDRTQGENGKEFRQTYGGLESHAIYNKHYKRENHLSYVDYVAYEKEMLEKGIKQETRY